ncbi:hypothetical protein V1278_001664 [Bradyrhizobium sp. AZCC 1577]
MLLQMLDPAPNEGRVPLQGKPVIRERNSPELDHAIVLADPFDFREDVEAWSASEPDTGL